MSPHTLTAAENFEDGYTLKFLQRFTGRGVQVSYVRDRAARDVGFHLAAPGSLELSDVRLWFQLKGIHASKLSKDQLALRDYVSVDLALDDVKRWYAAPEAVYVVVYLEATDEFIGEDIRDLADSRFADHHGSFMSKVADLDQKEVTLRVPIDAVIDEEKIASMLRYRAMRIDTPLWRGRPLGHFFDPLRCELGNLDPSLFVELVECLLSVHDFRITERLDSRDLMVWERVQDDAYLNVGMMYSTYEWPFSMGVEFGTDPGTDFREEGQLFRVQGPAAVMVHPTFPDRLLSSGKFEETVSHLEGIGAQGLLVIGNAPETLLMSSYYTTLFKDWRYLPPQGQGALAYSVLTAPAVFMEFQDRLHWKYVNYLWGSPEGPGVRLKP